MCDSQTDSFSVKQQPNNTSVGSSANLISSEIIISTFHLYWAMIILLIFSTIFSGSLSISDVTIDLSKAELDAESGNYCVIQKVISLSFLFEKMD